MYFQLSLKCLCSENKWLFFTLGTKNILYRQHICQKHNCYIGQERVHFSSQKSVFSRKSLDKSLGTSDVISCVRLLQRGELSGKRVLFIVDIKRDYF